MSEHGTYTRYTSGRCRCAVCRQANTDYHRNLRQQNRATQREPGKHGGRGYSNYGCRCDLCLEGQRKVQARFTTQAARNRNLDLHAASRRHHIGKVQAETGARAARHGRQWTGPELEVVAREDLSLMEKALLLGRTYRAVETMGHKLRREEPTPAWLAGKRARLH